MALAVRCTLVVGVIVLLLQQSSCNSSDPLDTIPNLRRIKSDKDDIKSVYVGFDKDTNSYFNDEQPKSGRPYVAAAFFRDDTNTTGWSTLEITNDMKKVIPGAVLPSVSDSVRAYTAGIAEGLLTQYMIDLHYLNTVERTCRLDPGFCDRLDTFLSESVTWMSEMVAAQRHMSSYWHHVGLYLEQVAGIADACEKKTFLGPRTAIYEGYYGRCIYRMNLDGERGDLQKALKLKPSLWREHGGCSAFIKILPDGNLVSAHDTWSPPITMLRVIKLYDLQLADVNGGNSKAASFRMTSYPGYVTSLDDFLVTTNRLAIWETTISNYNPLMYKFIVPKSVPTAIRSVVASRLAKTGPEWHDLFEPHNSCTYNNEWAVVDYNAWEAQKGKPAKSDILTVSEQMGPAFLKKDYTSRLIDKTYFPSYNKASMPEIAELSGVVINDYDTCPRAQIFARNYSQAVDLGSLLALMRYNNYLDDPLSSCELNDPPQCADFAIAARYDLNNREFAINGSSRWRMHMMTDCKFVDSTLIGKLNFVAQAGPTNDQVPTFKWSTAGVSIQDFPHYGQPDAFDFDPVIYESITPEIKGGVTKNHASFAVLILSIFCGLFLH